MTDIICKTADQDAEMRDALMKEWKKRHPRKRNFAPHFYRVSVEANSEFIGVSKHVYAGDLTIEQAEHLHACLGEAITVAKANEGKPDPSIDDDEEGYDYFASRLIDVA